MTNQDFDADPSRPLAEDAGRFLEIWQGALARLIRALRVDAGYPSYQRFAEAFGLPRASYWLAEKAERNTGPLKMSRIAAIHGLTAEEFTALHLNFLQDKELTLLQGVSRATPGPRKRRIE